MTKPGIEPFAKRWGVQGSFPKRSRRFAAGGYGHLNNRPPNVVHNHESGARIVYVGFSETAPDHHLFRCVAHSDPPRRQVQLKPFDQRGFTSESKAGRGGCSMRDCPGNAVEMDEDETQAYCEHCATRVRGIVPCSWTSIEPCYTGWGLDKPPHGRPCPTCTAFGREEAVA
jgi:hypothetical protein